MIPSLPSALAIPAIVMLAIVPGMLLSRSFVSRDSKWSLAHLLASLTLGLIVVGWLAVLLAEFGWFGKASLLATWAVLVGGLIIWTRVIRRRHDERLAEPDEAISSLDEDKLPRWELLLLIIWAIAAAWLFFRPHEYIFGGADAGVYISLGAELAQHGSFRLVDSTLAGLDPAFRDGVLRPLPNTPGADSYLLPGFYVTDAPGGAITPQFYPLHPVFQAIAFALAGEGAMGVRAELLLTGFWIVLGSLVVYLHAREIGGPVAAILTLIALSLSALQIWFARYPTSEALTQFLLWSGLWATSRWLTGTRPPALWAFTAGSALGAVFLVRIDSIVLLPVFSVLLVWRWIRGWRSADSWFALPLVLLFIHSLLHGHFLSGPYFYETMGYAALLLSRLWPLWLALIVVGVWLLWYVRDRGARLKAPQRLRRPVLGVLVGLVLAYAVYGWFLRPVLGETTLRPDVFSGGEIPVTNHENWLRLGWYLTPLGVWLGVLGSCLLLWQVNRRTVITLAVGFLFAGLYLWNISANPHHVYVMRRYVPVVVPFLTLSAGYLLSRGIDPAVVRQKLPGHLAALPPRVLPVASLIIALMWLGGLAWASRVYVSQVDHAGLTGQLEDVAERLPARSVLLFEDSSPVSQGDIWGTPLKYIYGHDVFSLRRPDIDPALVVEAITMWQNKGRQVVWVGESSWLDGQGYEYRTETVTLETRRLESSYTQKPQAIVPNTTTLNLHFIE